MQQQDGSSEIQTNKIPTKRNGKTKKKGIRKRD